MGIDVGYGAVSHLFFGDSECGKPGHKIANLRTQIYQDALNHWKAYDESRLAWESDDCKDNLVKPFPTTGDYSVIPQFATPKLQMIKSGETTASEVKADTCFIVRERTDYIVW